MANQQIETLGDALPKEMARVRDKVMPGYIQIGPPGTFMLALMQQDLDAAAKAMIEGDVAAMIEAYQSLQEYKEG